ncbi:MAG: hypothetical protein A2527_05615 [Candidatus Lambdaproteobacteria bacterium RIFOXYD2_FULL_50_16]|uniref:DUF262 domain-containing protein n=1 Tax=Candidatus Lambdaproteobacteria bacterium RIFOXYD2_FULL_50_16 TaxID=1817772 RepID=A0A1F6G983_9PROT|nr:MAG: hypothetical protein A2527_05615 [Candidatus Lambdaproteobacteria bacterium RIFOXYD2_FULL_50_16]
MRELIDDIQEASLSNRDHYLGTVVTSKGQEQDHFYIVDGQQRITSIIFLFHKVLPFIEGDEKIAFRYNCIGTSDQLRLTPLGRDQKFFESIVSGSHPVPTTKSQKYMLSVLETVDEWVCRYEAIDKQAFFQALKRLQILHFNEENHVNSIRLFQTVNDRGIPLTNMDKLKGLMAYHLALVDQEQEIERLNDNFGKMFRLYDDILDRAKANQVDLITKSNFNEDSILRFHFVSQNGVDYDATSASVLQWVKEQLKEHQNSEDSLTGLVQFVAEYTEGLLLFFESLDQIMEKVDKSPDYYKLFSILGLSATLYPLVIKLQLYELLSSNVGGKSLINFVEMIDVRVYKIRGTDPRAELMRFTGKINEDYSAVQVANFLTRFASNWMSDASLKANLSGDMYRNPVLPYFFLERSIQLSGLDLSLENLKRFNSSENRLRPTVEHILSQELNLNPQDYGFEEDEFEAYVHRVGNLTLLPKQVNSKLQNVAPTRKIDDYMKPESLIDEGNRSNGYEDAKNVAYLIHNQSTFTKDMLDARTELLIEFCLNRWPLLTQVSALEGELLGAENASEVFPETLPIALIPGDPQEFKLALLQTKKAKITIFYVNGSVEERVWDASNFQPTSNVIGNLRSRPEFRQGVWQQNNIRNIEVQTYWE